MTKEEYLAKVPHYCTFPHEHDACWGILYETQTQASGCRTCDYKIMAKRKQVGWWTRFHVWTDDQDNIKTHEMW